MGSMSAYRPKQNLDQPWQRPIPEQQLGHQIARRMLVRRPPFVVKRRPARGGPFQTIASGLSKTQARLTAIQLLKKAAKGGVVEISNLSGWLLRLKVVSDLLLTDDDAAETIRLARSQIGVEYSFGEINPIGPAGGPGSGLDCSGLFVFTFAQVGISLPHSANAIMHDPQIIRFSDRSLLRVGDFIFSHFPNNRGLGPADASHITQFTNPGWQIGSQPSTDGVQEIPLYGSGPEIGFGHIRGVTAPEAA